MVWENVKILWFLLLKCKYFLFSFVLCNSKPNIFGLYTKQDIWGCHLGLWIKHWSTFPPVFWHLIEKMINRLIDNEKKSLVAALITTTGTFLTLWDPRLILFKQCDWEVDKIMDAQSNLVTHTNVRLNYNTSTKNLQNKCLCQECEK